LTGARTIMKRVVMKDHSRNVSETSPLKYLRKLEDGKDLGEGPVAWDL